MLKCLYCQRENADDRTECEHCGMPLPTTSETIRTGRRIHLFRWFFVALVLFCIIIMIWFPRTIR